MIEFILNDRKIRTDKPSGLPLLDFIRYEQSLTGTKIGCREGDCGACNVLVGHLQDGQMKYLPITSCLTPIGNVQGKQVVTVEGLNMEDLSPVQQYMVDEAGTQCGFCTVGFIVSLTGYCLSHSTPDYKAAIAAIDGNICRCTGYKSIERAARHITNALAGKDTRETVDWLVERKFIPPYFKEIPNMLQTIGAENGGQKNGVLVGGGTDLYVQKHDQLLDREVDLVANHPNWRFITIKNGVCTLGGATTVTDVQESDALQTLFPRLTQHLKLVASSPIRNISTLAGNFVNASPIGDLTAFFLALNAKIELTEDDKSRTIFLKDFYKGYKDLDKTKGENITAISFIIPPANSHFNLEKVSKRIHLDIASVNTAAQIIVESGVIADAHISAGGVGPTPIYLKDTCAFLMGKPLTPELIRAAIDVLQSEISPISDVRGSENYKRLLLRQLFYAHFIKLFPNQISLEVLA
ncbi:MAG: xanthine dehydrogenase small subunit [Saprospiraceae bacterium]|nr:MAG: xanthine dehydrogenase small subunit [Saprospiraceae bacterium]